MSSTISEDPSGTSWFNRPSDDYMAQRAEVGLVMWPVGRGARHLIVGTRGVHVVVAQGIDVFGGLGLDLVDVDIWTYNTFCSHKSIIRPNALRH